MTEDRLAKWAKIVKLNSSRPPADFPRDGTKAGYLLPKRLNSRINKTES